MLSEHETLQALEPLEAFSSYSTEATNEATSARNSLSPCNQSSRNVFMTTSGFSNEEFKILLKKYPDFETNRATSKRATDAIKFLMKRLGFSNSEMRYLVMKIPSILNQDVKEKLEGVVDDLEISMDLPTAEIKDLVYKIPALLCVKLDKTYSESSEEEDAMITPQIVVKSETKRSDGEGSMRFKIMKTLGRIRKLSFAEF
jgi:hypothetical protein